MKRVIRLTESDLLNLVKNVLQEQKYGAVMKPVLCNTIGITDGHKWCNEKTKTKIIQIECDRIGGKPDLSYKTNPSNNKPIMCNGKDGLPIKNAMNEQVNNGEVPFETTITINGERFDIVSKGVLQHNKTCKFTRANDGKNDQVYLVVNCSGEIYGVKNLAGKGASAIKWSVTNISPNDKSTLIKSCDLCKR